jgi:hypothetical protein
MNWIRGRECEVARLRREPVTNRILLNVAYVSDVIVKVRDTTAVVAAFPYIEFAPETKREASLDLLHRLFRGNVRGRSQREMSVVGHDDKGV